MNGQFPYRKSMRLREYDYSQPGAYFVTICTHERGCLFGEIAEGVMRPNQLGEIVKREWERICIVRPYVETYAFVVMPNHLHGLVLIKEQMRTSGDPPGRPYEGNRARGPAGDSIGAIIGQYKSITAKHINAFRKTPGALVWQRNYYEHVIRNEDDLKQIGEYIVNNPGHWDSDENNPVLGVGDAVRRPVS